MLRPAVLCRPSLCGAVLPCTVLYRAVLCCACVSWLARGLLPRAVDEPSYTSLLFQSCGGWFGLGFKVFWHEHVHWNPPYRLVVSGLRPEEVLGAVFSCVGAAHLTPLVPIPPPLNPLGFFNPKDQHNTHRLVVAASTDDH